MGLMTTKGKSLLVLGLRNYHENMYGSETTSKWCGINIYGNFVGHFHK